MDNEKLKSIFELVNKKTQEKNQKIKEQEDELIKLKAEFAKLSKAKKVVSDEDEEYVPKKKGTKAKKVMSDEQKKHCAND